MKNLSKGTYYKDSNLEVLVTNYDVDFGEVDITELMCKWSITYKALHRATEGNNCTSTVKKHAFEVGKTYTFDLSMAD